MARARCRAACCSFAKEEGLSEIEIRDDYQIVLAGQQRQYFHVSCLEKLLDLPSLAPSRFKLDSDRYRWNDNWPWTWGLMLRKWFEHSGRIDINKIAEYSTAYDTYDKDEGDFDTQWITWQLAHQRKCLDGYSECPPAPIGPEEPILKDYKTMEGETCLLSEVLQHPSVEMLAVSIIDSCFKPLAFGFFVETPRARITFGQNWGAKGTLEVGF
jgi:hypothetical protein